jgi:hypothetical protein
MSEFLLKSLDEEWGEGHDNERRAASEPQRQWRVSSSGIRNEKSDYEP